MIVGYWLRGHDQSHSHMLKVGASQAPKPACGCDVSHYERHAREVVDGFTYLDCGNCLRIARASIRRQQKQLARELEAVTDRLAGKGGPQVDAFEEETT